MPDESRRARRWVDNERDGVRFHVSGLWRGVGWFRRSPASGSATGRPEVIEQKSNEPATTALGQGGKYYLVGFMGAGKTSVGSRLADLMDLEFVDLDREVEARANMSIPEIFAERGEQGFRRLEGAALRYLAGRGERLVIATGGGTVTRPENVELMRSTGITLWLDPSFEVTLSRLSTTGRQRRPLFASPAQARALYEQRRELYSTAGLRVELGPDDEPDEVAERIIRVFLEVDPARRSREERR